MALYDDSIRSERHGGQRYRVYGCTATFRHRSDGTLRTQAGEGYSRKAAKAIAFAMLDPEEWACICVSTPHTIYNDLKGRPDSRRAMGLDALAGEYREFRP